TLEKAEYSVWLLHLHPKVGRRGEERREGEEKGGRELIWGKASRGSGWEGGVAGREWLGTACSSAQSHPGKQHLP
ncbi:hypothetical protein N325_01761, partial [Colius striatus]